MQTHDFFSRIVATNACGPNMESVPNEPLEVFVCGLCDEAHEDKDSARECCPPDVFLRYQCQVCKDVHRRKEAAEACHPSGEHGQPMVCPVCLKPAEDFDAAADCCLHTHPTMTYFGRRRVAEAVENGASWPEAIAANQLM